MTMKQPFSFASFLHIPEQDAVFAVDETAFYFDDDPNTETHMLRCIRSFAKPYWVGYCDIPNGCEFQTALELLQAKIFDGRSTEERWAHIIWSSIGGIAPEEWVKYYGGLL